ncbi:thiamine pyrophosphokinase [Nitzschia inconspicua]|uniref:Thiamine pyrophosphokinase n=1 Tax=Nitzschia inconspicua TaxID=303405 RepID=A0A9K3LJP6_9STRA|nr:thiamine pyrophosphokinase [Nitzschia inconspicua]
MSGIVKTNGNGGVVSFTSPDLFDQNHAASLTTHNDVNSILVVLNMPIQPQPQSPSLERLWRCSQHRICADGGANRLYQYNKEYIPDRIRGDLDSLNEEVRAYYEGHNVSVEQDPCQDTNDLDKALQICCGVQATTNTEQGASTTGAATTTTSRPPRIYVYGAFGGRFDQEMASFAALYKWAPRFDWQMYLYSEETCAFLLPADRPCEIRLAFYDGKEPDQPTDDAEMMERLSVGEGPTCGLVPLACRCDSITTTGLKWDLDGTTAMEFGGLVSTSNRVMNDVVTVTTSHPVIFTAELQRCKTP